MSTKEILLDTNHRPWPLPANNWSYYQEWVNPVFLHWFVDADALQLLLPSDLQVDTMDGKAWISLVAFSMENIRPRGIMSFPPVSNFLELNVRTYVKFEGKPGVYFLSIEGGKWLSCFLANKLSELPYRPSTMRMDRHTFSSQNDEFQDQLSFEYALGPVVKSKTKLDVWLTERYALFQDTPTHVNAFELHHAPWQLHEVSISHLKVDYPRFNNFLKGAPQKVHFSPGVKVLSWERISHRKKS
ncbi:MAG: DUF2071 domain-containing protein [Saprospiraceae bacterium]|nr:DUF2071 domain-containing protein [Saprospiraceae bacterium]